MKLRKPWRRRPRHYFGNPFPRSLGTWIGGSFFNALPTDFQPGRWTLIDCRVVSSSELVHWWDPDIDGETP